MSVASEDGKAFLAIQCGDSRLTCTDLCLKTADGTQLKFTRGHKQVLMSGPFFEAMADRLKKVDETKVVLMGNVRLNYHKAGSMAEVVADKVIINLQDGGLEISSATSIAH